MARERCGPVPYASWVCGVSSATASPSRPSISRSQNIPGNWENPASPYWEKCFREGLANVLSCSTTMEMGIDIGGLTIVGMNNAPPGPANWLQGAGRAGRRDVSRATTLTLCQNLPHAEAVFAQPLWPFRTPVHVPQVSLTSQRIVQRHVQAMLLSRYLTQAVDNALRLECQWFFHSEDPTIPSPCDDFSAWLQEGAIHDEELLCGIERLVARSILESTPPQVMFDHAADAIAELAREWNVDYDALVEQLQETGGMPEAGKRPIRPNSGPFCTSSRGCARSTCSASWPAEAFSLHMASP